ncbi:MAG: nitronate monooxygenase [Gammaproteobacteria bacterium]|jgi:nitronate monooxygenase|nr:nitronate monooxygenase [Gammaproteobacteria bacterium]|tara:strand:- start:503 stop:1486 length:984 start_codon:yes stop_codon:yes gene_type:complete
MPIDKKIQDNISVPIIGAPLFLVSGPDLVIAQCKAGIIGSFPALNARPQHVLDEWIVRIKTELAEYKEANPDKKVAPFAVNQICHGSNDRLMDDMMTCVKHEVPIIITSLRPPAEVVEAAHSYGGKVFHDVISVRHAQKAAEQGVDGLILVCAGAGGHAGALSPFALLREVKKWFDGTVILSGSIGDGYSVASAIALGADFAYLGTRFIATKEANADQEYKKMLEESAASDIVYSSLFTGVHGNYLKPSIKNAGLDPDNLPEADKSSMNFGSGGNTDSKAWKDIWGSGQGIGAIEDSPSVDELVGRLKAEYESAFNDFKTKLEATNG